jgi:hypothetical protein
LIDYPGFNLRLAKAARARRPELKIIFTSPAGLGLESRPHPKMARYLD